jgi:hypothetical protein
LVHGRSVTIADGASSKQRILGKIFQFETLDASETEQGRGHNVVSIEEEWGVGGEDAGRETSDCPHWFVLVSAALVRLVRQVVERDLWKDQLRSRGNNLESVLVAIEDGADRRVLSARKGRQRERTYESDDISSSGKHQQANAELRERDRTDLG